MDFYGSLMGLTFRETVVLETCVSVTAEHLEIFKIFAAMLYFQEENIFLDLKLHCFRRGFFLPS